MNIYRYKIELDIEGETKFETGIVCAESLARVIEEVAKYFGVAESTISYWATLGMPVANIDGRKLYGKQSITQWLKSKEEPKPEQNKKPLAIAVVKDK